MQVIYGSIVFISIHIYYVIASNRFPRRQDTTYTSYNNILGMEREVEKWTKLISYENAFKPLLSRFTYRQKEIPFYVSFPCNHTLHRSKIIPESVHQLRPGDIDVVAAIGDSLTAGDAALEDSAFGIFIQYRGVSWSIGGQADWRKYLTLPNIIKHFNPNVTGYSHGEGSFQAKNSKFNVAMPAALDDDALKQAKILISRIKSDKNINFKKSWKLVTIFIGHNNLCSKACFDKKHHTGKDHRLKLQTALDYLQKNLPRTYVNLVTIADATFSLNIQRSFMCKLLHPLLCACLHRGPYKNKAAWLAKLAREYAEEEKKLVESGRYDNDTQFTVELQPFSLFTHHLGYIKDSNMDQTWLKNEYLIGPDCFHMSQPGSALMANMNWNNLLEPVGNKSINYPLELFKPILCPTNQNPYLFTRKNSEIFYKTGSQIEFY